MSLSLYELNNDKAPKIQASMVHEGLMSAQDKMKLDTIETNANFYTHPITHPISMIDGASVVAATGNYSDLLNKPTIPTTLPANGGNALTVGGRTASEFLLIAGGSMVGNLGINCDYITSKLTIDASNTSNEDIIRIRNKAGNDIILLGKNVESGSMHIKGGSKDIGILINDNTLYMGSWSNDDIVLTKNAIPKAYITDLGIKTSCSYKDYRSLKLNGNSGIGQYTWIKIPYNGQSDGDNSMKLFITRDENSDDAILQGGCTFEFTFTGSETSDSSTSLYGYYSEHGSIAYGQFISHAVIQANFIYIRILTGLTYKFFVPANSGNIILSSIEQDIAAPSYSYNVNSGYNLLNQSISTTKYNIENNNLFIEKTGTNSLAICSLAEKAIVTGKTWSGLSFNAKLDSNNNWSRIDTTQPACQLYVDKYGLKYGSAFPGTGNINFMNYKVWHEGNDGSGSNLDADTIDGMHASEFFSKRLGDFSLNPIVTNFGADGAYASLIANWPQLGYIGFGSNGVDAIKIGVVNSTHGDWLDNDIIDLYINKQKVWHEGNDGNGSTLDADLLDSFHANDINGIPLVGFFASSHYALIGTLPISNNATHDKLLVQFIGGKQDSSSINNDWVIMANRGGFNYSYNKQGKATDRTNFKIVAYQQLDGSVKVYAVATGYYAAIITARALFLGGTQTTLKIGSWSITAPTGNIVFDSAASTANAVDVNSISGLANVAKTGDYNDLINKPSTIPIIQDVENGVLYYLKANNGTLFLDPI